LVRCGGHAKFGQQGAHAVLDLVADRAHRLDAPTGQVVESASMIQNSQAEEQEYQPTTP
jgi:hypothetical protein